VEKKVSEIRAAAAGRMASEAIDAIDGAIRSVHYASADNLSSEAMSEVANNLEALVQLLKEAVPNLPTREAVEAAKLARKCELEAWESEQKSKAETKLAESEAAQ
jgi:hypothetical protein